MREHITANNGSVLLRLVVVLIAFFGQPVMGGSTRAEAYGLGVRYGSVILRIGREAEVQEMLWLDNRHLIVREIVPHRGFLLLLPGRRILARWQVKDEPRSDRWIEPDLPMRIAGHFLYYLTGQNIVRAAIIVKRDTIRLGPPSTVFDMNKLVRRLGRSGHWNSQGWMLWSPTRNGIIYRVNTSMAETIFSNDALHLGRQHVCAISDDANVWVTVDDSPRQFLTVWRVDPWNRKILWHCRLRKPGPQNEEVNETTVHWCPKQDGALVSFTQDTAGAESSLVYVDARKERTIFTPFEGTKRFPYEVIKEYPYAMDGYCVSDGVLFMLERGDAYRLAYWNARTKRISYPTWGRGASQIAVSPDEDKVALDLARRHGERVTVISAGVVPSH